MFPTADTRLNTAIKETSYYCRVHCSLSLSLKLNKVAPILKDLNIELRDERMNGTLWPAENPSFSRLEPSEEVEAVWNERFEPKEAFAITREDVVRLGKDPDVPVKLPNEIFGLGFDAYMASFDSLHKTHCLNELRKMTFADYGEEIPTKKKHGRLWWIHLRHCVDMLLQDLVCHVDADIITYTWVDTQHRPWADMSINRKCRNWDQVLGWGRQRYVGFDKLKEMRKPTGARILTFEKGYYETFGFDDSEMYPNGTGYIW
ncbi:MAG: hypothetical protein LQ351_003840 [Letrouitia transgressa]|nr:MAG: hypothetical protein LQ351_003840 [Letrouitia transgressa]